MSAAVTVTVQERQLYGYLAEDVAYLRQVCGKLVARFKGDYRVDAEVLTAAELQVLARTERERRAGGKKVRRPDRDAALPAASPSTVQCACGQPANHRGPCLGRRRPVAPKPVAVLAPPWLGAAKPTELTDRQLIVRLEGVVLSLATVLRNVIRARRVTGTVQRRLIEDIERITGEPVFPPPNQSAPTGSRQTRGD